MKKLIAILLTLALILGLAACGGPAPTDPPATEPPATEPPTTEPPATEPPATEPPQGDAPVLTDPVGTRFEAEDATMNGEFNPFGSGSDDGREENPGSSGGAHVGYFSTQGNTITWNINAEADATVTMIFRMASCNNNQDMTLEGHVTITVNGAALDLSGKVVTGDHAAAQTNYTYFQEVTFENVALVAGANSIVIECVGIGTTGSETFNVDYVEIIGGSVTAGEGGETGETGGLPPVPTGDGVVTGTQNIVVWGEEWGAVVAKTVVTLDVTVRAPTVTADSFLVYEVKEAIDMAASSGGEPSEEPVTTTSVRDVLNAYTCDAEGNPVGGDSNMICLELYTDPNVGGAFLYDFMSGKNTWHRPYELHLYTTENASLMTADDKPITGLNVKPTIDMTQAMMPQLDVVDMTGVFNGNGGQLLGYGSYAPPADDKQNALVIWLHGAGEGSADGEMGVEVANLGNEVTALYTEEFQSLFGGAYVLTPQTPTMWMDNGEGTYTEDGNSVYTDTLMGLIKAYVDANPDIDKNRIIIGGCSNGGYMTMNLIMKDPEYFAAAYPICEAYTDAWITDDMLAKISDLPIWFTYALNDTTVDPAAYSIPTIARLKAISDDVHVSEFENVYGETYMGHWSWLYFFNNECVDENGVNMWVWLSQQTK